MTILVLGDTHGRDLWESIIAKELAAEKIDKIIFIGDYFDSRDGISAQIQIENFENIMEHDPRLDVSEVEVIRLLGNHDYHYLQEIQEHYTKYQKYHAKEITAVLQKHRDKLLIAYSHDEFLFTHAGVSRAFCEERGIMYDTTILGPAETAGNIAEDLHDRFIDNPESFGFNPDNFMDKSGESVTQSPIWIRPKSLGKSIIPGIRQVVGHTTVENITTVGDEKSSTSITLVDTIAVGEYLIIKDGIMITKTITK